MVNRRSKVSRNKYMLVSNKLLLYDYRKNNSTSLGMRKYKANN